MLMARELGPGGTERQLTELARSLDRSRFQVHVACFREGIRASELKADGIPVVRLPVTSFMKPSAITGAWRLARFIRTLNIRVVHTFDYPLNCFGVPIARAAKSPIVLSSQRAHRHLTPRLYLRILRLTDRLVNGIVVNSEAVRRELILNERVRPSKIHLCHNGVDTARFNPEGRRRLHALENASLVIGSMCVLRPEKGLGTLIEGFARISSRCPGLRLAIVGSGPELPRLEELAKQLGVFEQCLFQPAELDVTPWLKSIDIFVLPSLSEALSNSLMEAMACGCACVASRTGGNPEIIRDGNTGLLFEPGDVRDLAGQLSVLIGDAGLRCRLADSGSHLIRERFSLARSVARMEEIYESHLEKDSRRRSR